MSRMQSGERLELGEEDRGHLPSQNSNSLTFFSWVTFFNSLTIVEQQFLQAL